MCMTKSYANSNVYNKHTYTDMVVHKVEQKVINRHQPWSRHYDETFTRHSVRKMCTIDRIIYVSERLPNCNNPKIEHYIELDVM